MSNLGGRRVLDLNWVESWARLVNEDRVLPVIGRFFTVRFVLGIDETDFLCEVRRGKLNGFLRGSFHPTWVMNLHSGHLQRPG